MSDPLSFDSTPNPAPYRGATAVWTTTGGNGTTVTWSSTNPDGSTTNVPVSVTVDRNDSTQATVTAGWEGMAIITASQFGDGGTSISRDVAAGAIYSYGARNLLGANSDLWTVPENPPSYVPSLEQMQAAGAAVAYTTENNTQNAAVLDASALEAERNGVKETCFFTATTPTTGNETTIAPNCPVYIYAPDGTLWLTQNGETITSTSPGFPARSDMTNRGAGLSWAPPDGLPSQPTVGASVTCYVLDPAQFPAASSSGVTYYTVARQYVAIQTTKVSPPSDPSKSTTATFTFPGPVNSAVVGISYWCLEYAGNTDHQTQTIALNVATPVVSGNTVTAQVSATLYGQSTNLDPNSSTINLCCIAELGGTDLQIALDAASGINSRGNSSFVNTPSPSVISQAFVNGWSASYGKGNQHHIKDFQVSASAINDGAQTAISGTVVMDDNSGNAATNPTLNGGLIVAGTSETGLVCTVTKNFQTTSTSSVTMPSAVSAVAPMIQNLCLSYGKSTDHDIRTIGGGTTGWSLSQDGLTVTLDSARAFMGDGKGDGTNKNTQNNDYSYVSFVVLGIPL